MPILTKEVEIIPSGKNVQYYRNLGYEAKFHKPLIVNIDDLQKGSSVRIEVLCDMCHNNSMSVKYNDYNKVIKKTGSYVCKECSHEKSRKTNLERYGVEIPSQSKQVQDKMRNTNLKRYGVEVYSKTKECTEKVEKTMKLRYGVRRALQNKNFQDAYKRTCMERYGEYYYKIFSNKAFDSYYKNTGYSNPFQSLEVKEKVAKTFYKNGTTKTSRQQLYLFDLFNSNNNVSLNYPISYYNADICFPEDKIIIEYDGGFHDGRVKIGQLTQEEFDQKEIIRNNIIKREGYKQMRIVSRKDLLPSDSILLKMLQEAKEYFSKTNHHWCTYDIDQSLLFSAEHKDGIYYDFCELRTIKDSDLNTIKDNNLNTPRKEDDNNENVLW